MLLKFVPPSAFMSSSRTALPVLWRWTKAGSYADTGENGGTLLIASIDPSLISFWRSASDSCAVVILAAFIPTQLLVVTVWNMTRFLPYQQATTTSGTAAERRRTRRPFRLVMMTKTQVAASQAHWKVLLSSTSTATAVARMIAHAVLPVRRYRK